VSDTPIYYESADGLRLYANCRASDHASSLPVLCLPGLTRNSKDFETISLDRNLIAGDFRGRGLSQYASDPATYRPDVELADTIALMDHLEIDRVAIIGTSRGGIVAMLMAALHPARVAGILFNDIGCVLEPEGLLRIRSYLGVGVNFTSWEHAVQALKASNSGFKSMTDDEWMAFARRIFKSEDGLPKLNYDPRLALNFPSVDDIAEGRIQPLWELFAAAQNIPVAILRGENSDLLSAATVTEMQNQNPSLDATTVGNRGHAPFLNEPESQAAIVRWLARVDAAE
jgi:pimeloyl-ACP methyl ester carboxylesterase